MDISQMNRSGKIASAVNTQKLRGPDGTLIPFIFFELASQISLGDEVLEERVNVLLQGEALCELFHGAKEGDDVVIFSAVAYVRNGTLCLRPSAPEQIKHYGHTDTSPKETFGLSREDFVKATELFKK